MYKLYGYNRGRKLLDMSDDKKDIIYTLGTYMGCLDTIDYEITRQEGETERTIVKIRSYDDYINCKYEKNKVLIKYK